MDGAREFEEANSAIFALIAPPGTAAAEATPTADGQGSVAAVFDKMSGTFKAEAAAGVDVIFQFNISGQGGGDWHCMIKDNSCTIESGAHKNPACTLKMADADFLAMMEGTLPAMQAYTSGKLKIEGDIMKSQLLEKLFSFGKK
jgi:putative sterol carrier protein